MKNTNDYFKFGLVYAGGVCYGSDSINDCINYAIDLGDNNYKIARLNERDGSIIKIIEKKNYKRYLEA